YGRFRRASWVVTRGNRWSWTTRCTSSRRIPMCCTRSTSRGTATRSNGSIDLTTILPFERVAVPREVERDGYPLKWKYRPNVDPNAVGIACCDAINRGAFYADGKVVYNLLDGRTVAIDATSGKELWQTRIADLAQGETTPVAT